MIDYAIMIFKTYSIEGNIKIAFGGLPSSFYYQMTHELFQYNLASVTVQIVDLFSRSFCVKDKLRRSNY